MEFNSCICINAEKLDLDNFPDFIEEYILDGLSNGEKIVILTDNIQYEYLETIFTDNIGYLIKYINLQKIIIKRYNTDNINHKRFLEILNEISDIQGKFRILLNLKNLIKECEDLHNLNYYAEKIVQYCCNKGIKNVVYTDNAKCNIEVLNKLCNTFDVLTVCHKQKHIIFSEKDEFEKATYFLQSYAEIKSENTNLGLFNETICNTPMNFHKDKFKNKIIHKLRELCDLDFCIMYMPSKERENILSIDNCFGITEKHGHYLLNDIEFIKFQNEYNNKIVETGKSILINTYKERNEILKNKLRDLGIISIVGVSVEYEENINAIVWIGRYESNKETVENSMEYLESICKTVFYIIREQERFFQLENKLIENEKLRAMGEMTAGIAHDINNILTPVIGSVQLLRDRYDDKTILKQLDIIEMCAHDGRNIANKVKKLTKNHNNINEVEIFDLDEVIMNAVDLTQNKWLTESILNGVKINVVTKLNSHAKIKGNSTELREVFINMITNAIDAMPLGGKIEISNESVNDYAVIEIKDNGNGMSKEIQKRVISPFFTTKGDKGCGLGLSISYNIVQSLGGMIDIQSEENVGTCFKIKLPTCKTDKKLNYDNKNNNEKHIGFSGNVLVIDDKVNIRNIVGDIIKSIAKCKVKKINGESLEEIEIELNKRDYDIVISDFLMPNVSGLEIAQRVKEINSDTYFCLMTGWIGDFKEKNMENIDNILTKPISKENIREILYLYEKRKIDV
ncbi:ATP-binding response regulator [Clostridium sp. ZS2-4]|uniref:ATP-binding response regulator n=1 Tax=Clostridium sp. ZS2-4 TaxID=2987703 RepID=UPI00227AAFCA|nr:hybrid sensor histidine kinase/response regulator [Clostridium sp. ZS2-4]MCY6353679.1 ATP-binding protein [Clostridium sp. ZS2-4]